MLTNHFKLCEISCSSATFLGLLKEKTLKCNGWKAHIYGLKLYYLSEICFCILFHLSGCTVWVYNYRPLLRHAGTPHTVERLAGWWGVVDTDTEAEALVSESASLCLWRDLLREGFLFFTRQECYYLQNWWNAAWGSVLCLLLHF